MASPPSARRSPPMGRLPPRPTRHPPCLYLDPTTEWNPLTGRAATSNACGTGSTTPSPTGSTRRRPSTNPWAVSYTEPMAPPPWSSASPSERRLWLPRRGHRDPIASGPPSGRRFLEPVGAARRRRHARGPGRALRSHAPRRRPLPLGPCRRHTRPELTQATQTVHHRNLEGCPITRQGPTPPRPHCRTEPTPDRRGPTSPHRLATRTTADRAGTRGHETAPPPRQPPPR